MKAVIGSNDPSLKSVECNLNVTRHLNIKFSENNERTGYECGKHRVLRFVVFGGPEENVLWQAQDMYTWSPTHQTAIFIVQVLIFRLQ
jgi:hypothetical protein